MDEVFVDLCRQMLRKDDDYLNVGDNDDSASRNDVKANGSKRRMRLRLRDAAGNHKCVIL